MKPKVSVIVPNYNHSAYLQQRLDSIFDQTYQDFEVILLDDCSTDDSLKILEPYRSHPKVSHFIVNPNNSGSVFKQWTKGINLAKGDYVWIAESDDYADIHFLETTLNTFLDHDSLGMVFTDTHKVDANGHSLGLVSQSKKILEELILEGGIIHRENVTKYLLKKMVIINASSVMFKKAALRAIDLETLKKFKNTGDVFVYIGLALSSAILFLPQPLNCMRLHADSTTKKNKKNGKLYKDKLLMLDHYLKDFQDNAIGKRNVVHFLKSNLFFALDHGFAKELKNLLKKMKLLGFISKSKYVKLLMLMCLYRTTTWHGKPYRLREFYKYLIRDF